MASAAQRAAPPFDISMLGGSGFRLRRGFACGKTLARRTRAAAQKGRLSVLLQRFRQSKYRFSRPFHVGGSFVSLAPTYFISQSALTPLLLLSKPDPLCCAPVWGRRFAAVLFSLRNIDFNRPFQLVASAISLATSFSFHCKTYHALIPLCLFWVVFCAFAHFYREKISLY